ncbi:MAG: energy transducer TonB [Emcibacter sp.]|nr:energy transducer TonB [Emcibacter sp.]
MRAIFYRKRAIIYALFFSVLLFLCLPLAQIISGSGDKKLIVRSIDIAPPAPPPPKRPDEPEDQQEEVVKLQDMTDVVPLEALDIDLNPNVTDALAVAVKTKKFKIRTSLAADFKTFDLGELDDLPRLINRPLYTYPASLSRRGIKNSVVEVMVIVHENGRLTIKKFTKLDYPELQSAAEKFIRQALFSAPKKDGKAVKGKFILPLELKDGA